MTKDGEDLKRMWPNVFKMHIDKQRFNRKKSSKTWSVMDYVLTLEEVSVYVTEDSCTPAL